MESMEEPTRNSGDRHNDDADIRRGGEARDDMREQIVDHATALFAHYGYSKTNISDIAQACGTSPGNLYRYFRNKQAIGHAVVGFFFKEEAARTASVFLKDAVCAEARLRALITETVMHTVEHLRQNPKIVELADMICETDEGMDMIRAHVDNRYEQLRAIIADGVAKGEFHVTDVLSAARAVQMGTKFFYVPFAIARHGLNQVEDDLNITLNLLCAGLRAG